MIEIRVRQEASSVEWIAPGGWKRAVISFAIGAAVGAVFALVVPRDERSYSEH